MKNFFLIVLVLFINLSYSQTHKATYSFKVEKNPITGSTKLADEINPLSEFNEFYIYFNNANSFYTSYNVENGTKDMSDAIAGCYDPVKYNYKTKTEQYNTEFDKLYVYNNTNLPIWTITNETKEIAGYTCIKANGMLKDITNPKKSYPFEAWFAPELPYPTGPKNFVNLPGMLVYGVFNNYQIFKLEKIQFNNNTLDIDAVKFEGDELSEEKYAELLKQLLKL